MNLLTAKDIVFYYSPEIHIFDEINFSIGEKEVIGLVGKNGSGKSTLFDILDDSKDMDDGEILKIKNLKIVRMSQQIAAQKSIGEFFGKNEHELTKEDLELINLLQIPPFSVNIADLSGGQKQRLSLAKTLFETGDIYLLDEPTNHLDLETVEKLEKYIKKSKASFIVISHDRYFLDRVCSRVLEIDKRKVYQYNGGYNDYLAGRESRIKRSLEKQRKKEEYLATEKLWVDSGVKARETKNKARLKKYWEVFESPDFVLDKKVVLKFPTIDSFGKKILKTKNLSVGFGDKVFVDGFDFEFQPGDRVGVVGNNGVGKTTLIKTLIGENEPIRGKVITGINTQINYISQDKDNLDNSSSVFDEITEKTPYVKFGDKKINAYYYLSQFLFHSKKLDSRVGQLSGGEKARLSLAKEIKRGGNFLVLDEPTNDLDVDMMEVLENSLSTFPGCQIIISHDRFFLDRICNYILFIKGDGSFVLSQGNWTDFENKYHHQVEPEKPKKKFYKNDPYQKFLNRERENKRARIKEIESEIDKYEKEKESLEIEISQPNLYNTDRERFDQINKRLGFLINKIDELTGQWEILI